MILERDETAQTAFEIKRNGRRVEPQLAQVKHSFLVQLFDGAQIEYRDAKPLDQVRLLAHVGDDGVPVQLAVGKDGGVGLEGDDGAVQFGSTDFLGLPYRFAAVFVFLNILPAIAMYFRA